MGPRPDSNVGWGAREERWTTLTGAALLRAAAYARTKGARSDDAPDVATEALVRLALERGRREVDRALRDVVRQILRRERRRESRRLPLCTVEEPVSRGRGPLEEAESAELARSLQEELAGLAVADRDILRAIYLESVTPADMARLLGITDTAMRQRLSRARRRLRHALEARLGEVPFRDLGIGGGRSLAASDSPGLVGRGCGFGPKPTGRVQTAAGWSNAAGQ